MEPPDEVLREEHEAIEMLGAALEGMAHRLASGDEVPQRDLELALEVAVEFADRCHHAKEEKILFPALSRASPTTGADLARRLTGDHQAFRKVVGATRGLVPRVAVDEGAKGAVAKNLDSYVRVLREHIRIENERLLPEISRTIPRAEQERISKEFENLEAAEMGAGVHERYHTTIHRLAGEYAHPDHS